MEKKLMNRAMYVRLKALINADNDDIDLVTQRHGFIVSCVVEGDDGITIMQYKLDPESHKFEDITDADSIGIVLHLAHKSTSDLFEQIIKRLAPLNMIRGLLGIIK